MLDSIDLAIELKLTPLKVNCVLMQDNDDELLDFAALSRDRPIDVRFIEYMPFDGNKWQVDTMVPFSQMIEQLREGTRRSSGCRRRRTTSPSRGASPTPRAPSPSSHR